jgi:hypothetical protein
MASSALMLSGCVDFQEVHYFQSVDSDGIPANYYRLTVTGNTGFSSANYISGFYDEHAVDLFFSESNSAGSAKAPYILVGCGGSPGKSNGDAAPNNAASANSGATSPSDRCDASKEQFTPANGVNGAFVMVLSTNADAVVNTIGSFAESNVTAQAISNLVNQSQLRTIQEAVSQQVAMSRNAKATTDELNGLLGQLPTSNMPMAEPTRQAYLRVLSAISRALGSAQNFQSFSEADAWFRAARLSTGTR